MTSRRLQIAVAGGRVCTPETARLARAVGREVAAAGAVLVCGGLGGAMEAVAQGAARAGGTVVGLLPDYQHTHGNRYLTIALPTGLRHARNVLVAAAGDALIAFPGKHGTLAEVALACALKRPVVVLGAWTDVAGVTHAHTPRDAVRHALTLARAKRTPQPGAGRGGRLERRLFGRARTPRQKHRRRAAAEAKPSEASPAPRSRPRTRRR